MKILVYSNWHQIFKHRSGQDNNASWSAAYTCRRQCELDLYVMGTSPLAMATRLAQAAFAGQQIVVAGEFHGTTHQVSDSRTNACAGHK